MFNKKSEDDKRSDDEKLLEQRVDDMMSVERAKPADKPGFDESEKTKDKVIKIETSAPELPSELEEEVKSEEPPAEPESEPDKEPAGEKVIKIPDSGTEPELPELAEEPSMPVEADLEPTAELEDAETEKAVDDIVAKEADLVLAVEDVKLGRKQQAAEAASKSRSRNPLKSVWTWIGMLALLAVAAGVLFILVYGYGLGG